MRDAHRSIRDVEVTCCIADDATRIAETGRCSDDVLRRRDVAVGGERKGRHRVGRGVGHEIKRLWRGGRRRACRAAAARRYAKRNEASAENRLERSLHTASMTSVETLALAVNSVLPCAIMG